MSIFVVYNDTTGVILRSGECDASLVSLQADHGEDVVEIDEPLELPLNQWIVDVVTQEIGPVLYSPPTASEVNRETYTRVLFSTGFSKTSDAAFATIDNGGDAWEFDLASPSGFAPAPTYRLKALLFITVGAGGYKLQITGTATVAETRYVVRSRDVATVVTDHAIYTTFGTDVGLFDGAAHEYVVEIEGIVVGSGGTLVLQFAQSVSNGTPSTVEKNSFMQLEQVQ